MFKRGFPPSPAPADGVTGCSNVTAAPGGLNLQVAAPFVAPPSTAPFNMQYGNCQPSGGFSQFMPADYQHFPYTFSSVSPPTYSWANTSSTDVMKFTGSTLSQPLDTSSFHYSNFGSVPKRKFDLDTDFPQPPKMRITEEKVSASLRDMHISKEFTPHSYCMNSNATEINMASENSNVLSTINTSETSKTEAQTTLVMCEELRKLNKVDSIVPQPFLNVERPNNAVVLWRKPKPLIEMFRSFSNFQEPESSVVITEITDDEENKIDNQNDMLIEDNNGIAIDDVEMEL